MVSKRCNRITPKRLQVISSQPKLSKTLVISKSLNKSIGVQSRRNLQETNNHLNRPTVAMEKTFLDIVIPERQCTYELSFQTIIQRRSLSSVLAENNPKCMRPGISAASKNILICQIMNGKSSRTNVWKRTKMVKQEL